MVLPAQSEYSKCTGHSAEFIREVVVPLVLLHSQPGIILHPDMEAWVPYRTGKELVDPLLGQTWDGQIEFFRSTELYGVAARKVRLLQRLNQIAQYLVTASLGAVSSGDTNSSKGVIG